MRNETEAKWLPVPPHLSLGNISGNISTRNSFDHLSENILEKEFPFSAHNVYIHFFHVALSLSAYPLKVARAFKNRHTGVWLQVMAFRGLCWLQRELAGEGTSRSPPRTFTNVVLQWFTSHAEMFTGLCLSSILQCEGTTKAEHTGLHKMCVHTHIPTHNTLHTQPHAQSDRLVVLQPLNCYMVKWELFWIPLFDWWEDKICRFQNCVNPLTNINLFNNHGKHSKRETKKKQSLVQLCFHSLRNNQRRQFHIILQTQYTRKALPW